MERYNKIILYLAIVCSLSGCTLFGLDLQEHYDYQKSYYDNQLNKTAWEFIQSRPDLFSGLMDAIEYVKDIEPSIENMYSDPNNTYLLLTNDALTNLEQTYSYFRMNSVIIPIPEIPEDPEDPENPDESFTRELEEEIPEGYMWGIASSWQQYDKERILELLKYHVVKGRWGYEELGASRNWHDTYASGDSAKVFLDVTNDRYGYLNVNNYTGLPSIYPGYKGDATNNRTWTNIRPRTPNLQATNGVIHVMDRFVFPPRRHILNLQSE